MRDYLQNLKQNDVYALSKHCNQMTFHCRHGWVIWMTLYFTVRSFKASELTIWQVFFFLSCFRNDSDNYTLFLQVNWIFKRRTAIEILWFLISCDRIDVHVHLSTYFNYFRVPGDFTIIHVIVISAFRFGQMSVCLQSRDYLFSLSHMPFIFIFPSLHNIHTFSFSQVYIT